MVEKVILLGCAFLDHTLRQSSDDMLGFRSRHVQRQNVKSTGFAFLLLVHFASYQPDSRALEDTEKGPR